MIAFLLGSIFFYLGYGVFAVKKFEKDDFLLEYVGEFVNPKNDFVCQDYLYYFKYSGQSFWYKLHVF